MSKDYYKILVVPRGASQEQIKKAYRKLAMQYHPDRNPGKEKWANDKFKGINEAFSVLGDPDKRAKYDRFGTADGVNIGDVFSSSSTRGTVEDLMRDFRGAGLGSDFLENIFGNLGKGGGFTFFTTSGGQGRGKRQKRRGATIDLEDLFGQAGKSDPVQYELSITTDEARTGTKKILQRKGRRLEVDIPAAVKTGSLVKLTNACQVTDGCTGDILIRIKIKDRNKVHT